AARHALPSCPTRRSADLILGLPPVVTRYASAAEQVEDGVDGFILENQDQALYQGLRDLVLHPEKLDRAREALRRRSYSNREDIRSEEHTSELQSRFDLVC